MTAVLRLTVGRDTVRADLVRWKKTVWAAEARHSGPADLSEVIAQLAADLPPQPRAGQLSVQLEAGLVQYRTLTGLPPVRPAALARLVALQSGRFFRRNGTPLVTDARWGGGRRQRSTAHAVAVEQTWTSSIVAAARQLGIPLDSIGVAGGAGVRYDLLPPDERAARRRAELGSVRTLAALSAAVWLAGGSLFLLRLRAEGQRIERELDALREPVAAVALARRELAEAGAMVEAVAESERNRHAMLARIAGIARAMPDSSYLTSMVLDTAGGTISGRAREAARVVAALERGEAAPGIRLEGPVVRELAGGREWERFNIRFAQGHE